jgi:aconitate hydratase
VLLKVGDNVSTDEISPAGAAALPYRSNIPKLAEFTFTRVDRDYPRRAAEAGPHVVVAGDNYGQGSSREHAAITPRYLGLRAVLARSYARIHWQNLANFGILPLEFTDPADYDRLDPGHTLHLDGLHDLPPAGADLTVLDTDTDHRFTVTHHLSARQLRMILAGGQIPLLRTETHEEPQQTQENHDDRP